MDTNGASHCPVCKKQPTVRIDAPINLNGVFLEESIVLRCERHGYVACGNTIPQAIQHWNKFVGSIARATYIATALNPGPSMTSPCLYCQKDTLGHALEEPTTRIWVECQSCHMIKYERFKSA